MICPISDLPTDQCGCHQHHRPAQTVISIAALERIAGHPLPQARLIRRDPRWKVPEPTRTVCTHRADDLCGDCDTLLRGLLADLPELVEQLTITLRKGHRFAPRGFRHGDKETPDEAPIPWNPPAVRCLADLHRFMLDAPLADRHWILTELSALARRAHRIIDRPTDREITICPECRTEIIVTDRARTVTCGATIVEDDPDTPEPAEGEQRPQRERVCRYAAGWEQHRKDLLTVNADAMLTMNQLVLVFSEPGTPPERVRNRINYLIRRHGLPREQIEFPEWNDGQLRSVTKWVYRIRDIEDLQAQLARKAG